MGTTARDTGNGQGTFLPAPAGTHRATCYMVVDLGTQETSFNGVADEKDQILLAWELADEVMADGRPFTLNRIFTLSLHQQSALRPFLESWRGRAFTEEEAKGFDVAKLIGVPAQLVVVHKEGKGRDGQPRTFANVAAAIPLGKGQARPTDLHNEKFVLSLDDKVIPESCPFWVADKIRKSKQYEAGGFDDMAPTERPGAKDKDGADTPRQAPRGAAVEGVPKDGKELFIWASDRERETGMGLLKYIAKWGQLNDFPVALTGWDAEQAAAGHAELVRKLESVRPVPVGAAADDDKIPF
jgi:hypothetical protein